MKIPKIIHFICIKPMTFSLIHYLAVISAHEVHKPDKIYMYYDSEQDANIYWDAIKKYVTLEQITPPLLFGGLPVTAPQYKADIIRLEKLLERGGFYIDLDVLSLKSFDEFLDNDCVMSGRPSEFTKDIDKLGEMQNSIILTIPNNPFIKKWYDEMPKYMHGNYPWSYHAVCLPVELIKKDKNILQTMKILDCDNLLMPFCWDIDNPYIFDEKQMHMEEKLNDYYTIMFFQTIVFDKYLSTLNVAFFKNNNNLFTKIFSKYVKELYDYQDKLRSYVWIKYSAKEYNTLLKLCDQYITFTNEDYENDDVLQHILFFRGFAHFHIGQLTDSKNDYRKLLKLKNLNKNVKEWIPHNLALVDGYLGKRKAETYREAFVNYGKQDWNMTVQKCSEYLDILMESNYELHHILFFLAYAQNNLGNKEKSRETYDKLLRIKDIHKDVKAWATHNAKVL